ncbi:MAG: hypothetical protein CVU40_16395 [Chloroflexi bacterium HGW-Chloroflexi-2]|nr:MAG: hypothetical protein CVU40_16395 [Chloroflexi bacterium HGW-Chloroflexi-2]
MKLDYLPDENSYFFLFNVAFTFFVNNDQNVNACPMEFNCLSITKSSKRLIKGGTTIATSGICCTRTIQYLFAKG